MAKVMDFDTAEHFYKWLETQHPDSQHHIEQAIYALLADDPEIIKGEYEGGLGWGWTECRDYALNRYPEA